MRTQRSGAALASVLLLFLVLAVMLKSLVFLLASRSFTVRSTQHQTQARFMAQAGLAHAQDELTKDPDWKAGFDKQGIPGSPGTYTLKFASGHSVNNMMSASAADGPRGPGTVPPYTADVIVTGEVEGSTCVLEALVSKQLEDVAAVGVSSSGRIFLRGDVSIDGIKAMDTQDQLPTGIHSNARDTGATIEWDPIEADDRCQISGDVTATSPDPNAIRLNGSHTVRAKKTGVDPAEFPQADIRGAIESARGYSAPTFTNLGTSNLPNGKFFKAGDVTLDGDLVLNDTTLYVDGNLKVNGSISGTGAVFVKGQTSLLGDSQVATSNSDGVALYSDGSVDLQGFDGNAYLRRLAQMDPTALDLLNRVQNNLNILQEMGHPPALTEGVRDKFRTLRLRLGWEDGEDDNKLLRKLKNRVEALNATDPAESKTRDFLMAKIGNLSDFFGDAASFGGEGTIRAAWSNKKMPKGFCEILSDGGEANKAFFLEHREEIYKLLDELDFNKVGTSYFQGIIYTHGSLYASHEVRIVGSVWAEADPTKAAVTRGDRLLKPGDIFLDQGVSLLFSKEYALVQGGITAGALPASVRVWYLH